VSAAWSLIWPSRTVSPTSVRPTKLIKCRFGAQITTLNWASFVRAGTNIMYHSQCRQDYLVAGVCASLPFLGPCLQSLGHDIQSENIRDPLSLRLRMRSRKSHVKPKEVRFCSLSMDCSRLGRVRGYYRNRKRLQQTQCARSSISRWFDHAQ
jgi:hypothetical protein